MNEQPSSVPTTPSALDRFLGGDFWRQARGAMVGRDNRVLLIAPSERSGFGAIGELARELLETHGFIVHSPYEGGNVEDELDFAIEFQYILCIVATIGTASETLLLLNAFNGLIRNDAFVAVPLPTVNVIVPKAYRDAYFARVTTAHFKPQIHYCCAIDSADPDFSQDDISTVLLNCLAQAVMARHGAGLYRLATSEIRIRADDQERRAIREIANTEPTTAPPQRDTPSYNYWPPIFVLGVIIVLALVLFKFDWMPVYVAGPLFVICTILLIMILLVDKLGKNAFMQVVTGILDKVPGLGHEKSQPQSEADSNKDADGQDRAG
jgi:hypothetical protein